MSSNSQMKGLYTNFTYVYGLSIDTDEQILCYKSHICMALVHHELMQDAVLIFDLLHISHHICCIDMVSFFHGPLKYVILSVHFVKKTFHKNHICVFSLVHAHK